MWNRILSLSKGRQAKAKGGANAPPPKETLDVNVLHKAPIYTLRKGHWLVHVHCMDCPYLLCFSAVVLAGSMGKQIFPWSTVYLWNWLLLWALESLHAGVSCLVHYSTVVLTESAGVCTNRFFHEAPILRRVFMKLVVFVSTLKFVLCIVCMRLSPIRCTIQLVLTERLFPRSTRIEGCIHEIDCFCEHLKKKACCDKLPAVLYQLWFPPKTNA